MSRGGQAVERLNVVKFVSTVVQESIVMLQFDTQ